MMLYDVSYRIYWGTLGCVADTLGCQYDDVDSVVEEYGLQTTDKLYLQFVNQTYCAGKSSSAAVSEGLMKIDVYLISTLVNKSLLLLLLLLL